MAMKRKNGKLKRRDFLKKVTAGGALAETLGSLPAAEEFPRKPEASKRAEQGASASAITYPRIFTGRNLRMIAFPLGGIGPGSIALGVTDLLPRSGVEYVLPLRNTCFFGSTDGKIDNDGRRAAHRPQRLGTDPRQSRRAARIEFERSMGSVERQKPGQ